MTQLTFTIEEEKKLHILKEVIEKKLKQKDWALQLWMTDRQMRRLQADHKIYWDSCVIHWLKGKDSNFERKDHKIIKDIIAEPKYEGFWPTLLTEHLQKDYGVDACIETVRKDMIASKKRFPKSKKHVIYRQERPRKDKFGMMVQFDGSYHKWFEERDEECCLLLSVDDATGHAHMMFCENESFECVSRFWIQYILKYGIPLHIYLDKFSSYKVNHPKAVHDTKLITNFQRIMRYLGCELIFANSPQAKWRVERMNQTLQDRWVKEMRLAWISNVVSGNIYLQQTYIKEFNAKFSVPPHEAGDCHIPNRHSEAELRMLFAKVEMRKLGNDNMIQYKNRFFQILEWEYTIYPKRPIEVHETYEHKLYFKIWTKFIKYVEADAKSVRLQRAKYRSEVNRIKKEKQKLDFQKRAEARHEASKKRQAIQRGLFFT